MNFQEFCQTIATGVSLGIDSTVTVKDVNGECVAGGFVALPLDHTTPRYERNQIYEIKFSDRPNDSGVCFLLTSAKELYTYSAASGMLVAAFLADAGAEDVEEIASGGYRFKKDYILISPLLRTRYLEKFKSASYIWGGFYHEAEPIPSSTSIKVGNILAYPDLSLPTELHKIEAYRANSDASSIGRFLALYHLLELSFDYDLIQDIKALPHDLRAVGKLLAEFDHGELPRLNRMVKKAWADEVSLAAALGKLFEPSAYDAQLEDLLFGYNKDGFPWLFKDDQARFQKFIAQARASFSADKFNSQKLGWTLESLQKAICFIIYRFRCAIAHASIGECILSSQDDKFVELKAEPLILSAISKIYFV